jgi:hypothetical protein
MSSLDPLRTLAKSFSFDQMSRRIILISGIAVVLSAYAGWWAKGFLVIDACLDSGGRWQGNGGYCQTAINPIEIAERYALEHEERGATPAGLDRQWWVRDHGDIWIVDLGAQGGTGSIRMAILKRDGKVLGHDFTQ